MTRDPQERIAELLEANNALLERARRAERNVRKLVAFVFGVMGVSSRDIPPLDLG